MTSLRQGYDQWLADELRAQCRRAFADDLDEGRRTWLRRYGQAIVNGRLSVCDALTTPGWLPEAVEPWRAELGEATRRARRSEWHLAVSVFDRVLGVDPPPKEQVQLLAMASRVVLGWLADSAAAEDYARRAAEIAPDAREVVAARSYLAVWKGNQEQAERLLEGHLAQHPDDGACQTYYALSALWWELPEVTEARALEGLGHAGHESGLYQMLMAAYAAPALFPDRATHLLHVAEQRMALDPDDAYDTEVDLGVAFRENGQVDAAREHLGAAVDLDPTRPRALGELARLLAGEEQFDEAAAALDRALAIDPRNTETLQLASEVADLQGRTEEGESWLRRAAEEGWGNTGSVWAALAERQAAAGQLMAAWATAERAVAVAPELRTCLFLTGSMAARWRTDPDSVRRLVDRIVTRGRGRPGRGPQPAGRRRLRRRGLRVGRHGLRAGRRGVTRARLVPPTAGLGPA